MQADAVPDELRRQHIAFEELADQDDAGDDEDMAPLREKLRDATQSETTSAVSEPT